MQYYIKEGIGKYLVLAEKAFDKAKVTLSSGDMEQMKQAINEMKIKLLKIDVLNHQKADLISWFSINTQH